MVDIVRCQTPHAGHAGPVPARQCKEEGCTRPVKAQGRCNACYLRWWSSPEFVRAPQRQPFVPIASPVCPWCGPYTRLPQATNVICPTCGLDAAEIAYAERIIADSTAVYVEEVRAYRAKREMQSKVSEASSVSEALRLLGFEDLADALDQSKGGS